VVAATTVLLIDQAAVLRVADRAVDDASRRQAPQLGFLGLMNGVRALVALAVGP
jgi:hypothetical protein